MATQKVTISLDPALIERIDAFADDNGMTRSGMISMACKQYLHAAEVMPSMSHIIGKFAEVIDNKLGLSAEEQAKQLDELEQAQQKILGGF